MECPFFAAAFAGILRVKSIISHYSFKLELNEFSHCTARSVN